jgi:hypothetical protein
VEKLEDLSWKPLFETPSNAILVHSAFFRSFSNATESWYKLNCSSDFEARICYPATVIN